jgi:hypothetical protein
MIILLPVTAPLSAIEGIAGNDGRQRRQAADARRAAAGLPPGKYLEGWVYLAASLAIPGITVAAWCAIWAARLPPAGPVGLCVALLLTALFGSQNMLTLVIVGFNLARRHGEDPAVRPIRNP